MTERCSFSLSVGAGASDNKNIQLIERNASQRTLSLSKAEPMSHAIHKDTNRRGSMQALHFLSRLRRCSPLAIGIILLFLSSHSTVAGWQTCSLPTGQARMPLNGRAVAEKTMQCEPALPDEEPARRNGRRRVLGLASGLLVYPGVSDAFYACNGGGNPTLPPCPVFNISRPENLQSIQQIRGSYSGELEAIKNVSRALKH